MRIKYSRKQCNDNVYRRSWSLRSWNEKGVAFHRTRFEWLANHNSLGNQLTNQSNKALPTFESVCLQFSNNALPFFCCRRTLSRFWVIHLYVPAGGAVMLLYKMYGLREQCRDWAAVVSTVHLPACVCVCVCLVVLGGIPVHTEYRCLFFLRYEFLKYRNTGVI